MSKHRVATVHCTVIAGKHGECTLEFIAHETQTSSERLIEPEFYRRDHPNGLPEGPHIELELFARPLWVGWDIHPHVHIHLDARTNRPFVCFTGQIKNETEARTLLRMWVRGTVYTWLTGNDFIPVQQEHGKNFGEYLRVEHNIEVVDIEFSSFMKERIRS